MKGRGRHGESSNVTPTNTTVSQFPESVGTTHLLGSRKTGNRLIPTLSGT